ncbi:MAG TPA: CapA family protein, partial [Longimicrobiales bacterium]|nr:CapA family protein [Longimicrobiales bacterium]
MRHVSAAATILLLVGPALGGLDGARTRLTAQASRPAELSSSVDDGFTIAVVGDVIIAHSLEHMMSNPRFAEVVELLRGADVATGNLETQIIDGRSFVGARGGGTHGAEPESAEWLEAMGFDILARPNNHAND